jgi:hypothetical protein
MKIFISGAITMGYFVVTLCFLRFWKKVQDRLFILFALAFAVLGIERILFTFISPTNEITPYIYSVRLIAFALILFAIVDKNRPKPSAP